MENEVHYLRLLSFVLDETVLNTVAAYYDKLEQELIMEMRYPNVTWRIILPVYLFTTELRHTCSLLIFF